MEFDELSEFTKEIKKLSKKYKTLSSDLDTVKKVLRVNPKERPPFSFKIDGLGVTSCIIKIKKIASKSFKGRGVNSGFRLIYAHFEKENRISFIEIYHKSIKSQKDKERIKKYFK